MTRLDKWLWAARFFKTRGAATAAVSGGRVHLNGERVKPSKEVRLGDRVEVRVGQTRWSIVVNGLSDRRGPAGAERAVDSAAAPRRERRPTPERREIGPGWKADPTCGHDDIAGLGDEDPQALGVGCPLLRQIVDPVVVPFPDLLLHLPDPPE